MSGRYFVQSFGCRVNQADSAGLVEALPAGLLPTQDATQADVVVLNTCTVTHRSDADVRKTVRRIHRDNPAARIIVTGCYAQRDPEGAQALSGVSAVVGTAERSRLPILVERYQSEAPAEPELYYSEVDRIDPARLPPVDPVSTVLGRTRPFVKIQDGCDAYCSYCIIPSVRGRGRSAAPEAIEGAMLRLIAEGYAEIVIAGVHLGRYGLGPGADIPLDQLIARLLELPGLQRLRLSGVEPMAFSPRLIELAAKDPRLCPHFHLPLQAGSDRVLKKMGRPYSAEDYLKITERMKASLPHACLGSDLIVGFPGETEADLERSMEVLEAAEVDHLHVFSYSDRAGAPATKLKDKVDPRIVKERSQRLHAFAKRRWRAFLERNLGSRRHALILGPNPKAPGQLSALADNYLPLSLPAEGLSQHQLVEVEVTALTERGAMGRPS